MSKLPKCFVEEFENIPEHVDRLIYVRDDNRKKIGVIIINNGACGWSLCNDLDQWDTFSGILVAWERLMEGVKVDKQANDIYNYHVTSYNGDKRFTGTKSGILFLLLNVLI